MSDTAIMLIAPYNSVFVPLRCILIFFNFFILLFIRLKNSYFNDCKGNPFLPIDKIFLFILLAISALKRNFDAQYAR